MVKNILLKCDEAFFNKMKRHKAMMEYKLKKSLTWEQYVSLLFGFRRHKW